MKVVGFCGVSGSGKTTLIEGVIAALRAEGQRVSVIKHSHKRFEIDHAGKDTWRHREAGAFEVMIASRERLAKVISFEQPSELGVHELIATMQPVDWLLIEGFKHADLLKVEVWRAACGAAPLYPDDAFVAAVATDAPAALPVATQRPVFRLDAAADVAGYLLRDAARFAYRPQRHG
jgi:molybdopterin-guanine dinucleotide biosynthesis protein B